MANPAAPIDVEARWRPLSDQETTNAETFLDDAWVMLKRRLPTIEADMVADTSGDLTADVIRVLATAVARVLKNPEGKAREAIDDYSWSLDSARAAGELHFTDAELSSLVPGGKGRSFGVDLIPDYCARFEDDE